MVLAPSITLHINQIRVAAAAARASERARRLEVRRY